MRVLLLTLLPFSEEELTLTRENSIRRLHSHHSDPRSQVGQGSPLDVVLLGGTAGRLELQGTPLPTLQFPGLFWSCCCWARDVVSTLEEGAGEQSWRVTGRGPGGGHVS